MTVYVGTINGVRVQRVIYIAPDSITKIQNEDILILQDDNDWFLYAGSDAPPPCWFNPVRMPKNWVVA